jgi:putative toxin-antitoxin system antitoxin component (TIGR02293 family)
MSSPAPRSAPERKRGRIALSSSAEILGLNVKDALSLAQKVEEGFPIKSFNRLQTTLNIGTSDLARIVRITTRTLARRRAQGHLEPEESDRLLRVTRVYRLALDLFESDHTAALAWLSRPNRALEGNAPLRLSATEVGAREVERLITRLEHGVTT